MNSKLDSISMQEWAQLQEVFDQAIELPQSERGDYLDLACGGDIRLRSQIDALILAAEADDELVGNLVKRAVDRVLEENDKTRNRQNGAKTLTS